MDNYRDFEKWAALWCKVGRDQDNSKSWLYVSALFNGFAAARRNNDVEIDCYFLADWCRTKAGL